MPKFRSLLFKVPTTLPGELIIFFVIHNSVQRYEKVVAMSTGTLWAYLIMIDNTGTNYPQGIHTSARSLYRSI
jgi:hypothetical protein